MLTLYSFRLCPYVQRAVIVLKLAKIPVKTVFIDTDNKPQELLEVSPNAEVPVLVTEDGPLFESSIITEYLNEQFQLDLLSQQAYQRARERITIELINQSLSKYFACAISQDQSTYQQRLIDFKVIFSKLLNYCNLLTSRAEAQNLVHIAFYPLALRLSITGNLPDDLGIANLDLNKYLDQFKGNSAYSESVVGDFSHRFVDYLKHNQSSYIIKEGYL